MSISSFPTEIESIICDIGEMLNLPVPHRIVPFVRHHMPGNQHHDFRAWIADAVEMIDEFGSTLDKTSGGDCMCQLRPSNSESCGAILPDRHLGQTHGFRRLFHTRVFYSPVRYFALDYGDMISTSA